LVAVPHRPDALSRGFGRTHAEYALDLNVCRRSCGHVWQARFFSCPLSSNHVWNAMAYVERNPVRAGLSARATQYEWSSARAHANEDDLHGFLHFESWRSRYNGRSWEQFLDSAVEEQEMEKLREATQRGRPCAEPDTIIDFERRLGRGLRPRSPGRPKKEKADLLSTQSSLGFSACE
jgi:putative transposase